MYAGCLTNEDNIYYNSSKKRFINSIIEAENKSEVFNILTEKHGKNLIGIKEINKIC